MYVKNCFRFFFKSQNSRERCEILEKSQGNTSRKLVGAGDWWRHVLSVTVLNTQNPSDYFLLRNLMNNACSVLCKKAAINNVKILSIKKGWVRDDRRSQTAKDQNNTAQSMRFWSQDCLVLPYDTHSWNIGLTGRNNSVVYAEGQARSRKSAYLIRHKEGFSRTIFCWAGQCCKN